jgi:hypothetical protein
MQKSRKSDALIKIANSKLRSMRASYCTRTTKRLTSSELGNPLARCLSEDYSLRPRDDRQVGGPGFDQGGWADHAVEVLPGLNASLDGRYE